MRNQLAILLTIAFSFLVCFCSHQEKKQTYFEGRIVLEISDEDGVIATEYFVKGKKTKTVTSLLGDNFNEPLQNIISNGNKTFLLMQKQKTYMEIDNNFLSKSKKINNEKSNLGISDKVDFLKYKTGKTKNIVGYRCEQIVYNENNLKNVIWVTDEIDEQIRNNLLSQNFFGGKSFSNKDYVYLLFTTTDNTGKIVTKLEVKNIDTKPLDNSIFMPPSDYTKMDITKVKFD